MKWSTCFSPALRPAGFLRKHALAAPLLLLAATPLLWASEAHALPSSLVILSAKGQALQAPVAADTSAAAKAPRAFGSPEASDTDNTPGTEGASDSGKTSAFSDCFEEAALRFGLNADLLRAIALVESSGNPAAVGRNRTSEDLGLMQINSSWIARFNTSRGELLSNACRNIEIGAFILEDNFKKAAHPWEAVGAYNASCTRLKEDECTQVRRQYAWKVYRALAQMNDALRMRLARVAPSASYEASAAGSLS